MSHCLCSHLKIIIINWTVYNRWFLSKAVFGKKRKEVTLYHWGFVWGGGSGTCFVFGVVGNSSTPGPPSPPHLVARGARPRPPSRIPHGRDRRCDPAPALCSQDCCFSWTLQPSPAPPSSQQESCQLGGGLQQSRGGHRCQDGCDLGRGN